MESKDLGIAMVPGRSCPVHYRYPPAVFAREPEIIAEALYVIGGLYGNRPALDAILSIVGEERGSKALVFNGDFNWFNVDDEGFSAINAAVLSHVALRGNVETELASDDGDAGCGCAYPDSVSDADVSRSNSILERLRMTARRFPAVRQQLGSLRMHAVAQVGAVRIGIVHGDAESLAGWQFDVAQLNAPGSAERVASMFKAAQVHIFASSHTCLPVLREFLVDDSPRWVINNGAAGIPNFKDTQYGLITRISLRAAPAKLPLYGVRAGDLFVDAIPAHYDQSSWLDQFLANWPVGSAAYDSYHKRIVSGPMYLMHQARSIAPIGAMCG